MFPHGIYLFFRSLSVRTICGFASILFITLSGSFFWSLFFGFRARACVILAYISIQMTRSRNGHQRLLNHFVYRRRRRDEQTAATTTTTDQHKFPTKLAGIWRERYNGLVCLWWSDAVHDVVSCRLCSIFCIQINRHHGRVSERYSDSIRAAYHLSYARASDSEYPRHAQDARQDFECSRAGNVWTVFLCGSVHTHTAAMHA